MEMLEKGGITSLDNKYLKDFENAEEYGIGGELRKAFKKLGPAIGATIGAVIGGPVGASIGAGIGTKTSASDNYAQNMLAAFGLAKGFGATGQGLGSLGTPVQSFQDAFKFVGDSPLGKLFGIGTESSALDKFMRNQGYTKTKGGFTKGNSFISNAGANTQFGAQAQQAAASSKGILDRVKETVGSGVDKVEKFYEDNENIARLAESLLMPKIVEAIYGSDPYGTQSLQFAQQGLRPAVNPLQNNEYIKGSTVAPPQFPNLEKFVGAQRAMFGGKIGMKNGGPKPDEIRVRPDGEIRGPGTPTSDDIPVYLSDQEYVLPKVMVDYLGNGSYDKGIAALEEIRTKLV
jgi:hypothetical protein